MATEVKSTNENHMRVLDTLRAHILEHQDDHGSSTSLNETHVKNLSFEKDKDKWESIGFQNGNKPFTDCRAVGIGGLILIIEFLERVENMYMEAQNVLIQLDDGSK